MTPKNYVTYFQSLDQEPQIVLYMDNYTDDCEYCVCTKPGYTTEFDDNVAFITFVYLADPLTGDIRLPPLEVIYSDSESEAEKKHREMLDNWNNIQYSPQSEVTDETVQDWGLSDVFGI